MAGTPGFITVKVEADTIAAMETVSALIRDELVNYSEWLDSNTLLGDSADYPASLTHDELVSLFISRHE